MEETWELAVVTTSAESLHNALEMVSTQHAGLSFSKAVMKSIGNPEGEQSEAFRLMSELYLNLDADIEAAFEDKLQATLKSTAAPFKILLRFSTYDMLIKNLTDRNTNNILSAAKINSLLMLDAALQGKCERPSLEMTDEIKAAFSDLRAHVAELSLPSHIQRVLEIRIDQIERTSRDFSFYGTRGLSKSIEELVGAVEVHVANNTKNHSSYKKFRRSLTETILTVTGAVSITNTAVKEVKMLTGHVAEVVALLPDFTDSKLDLETTKDDQN